jgi:hypothetical protein
MIRANVETPRGLEVVLVRAAIDVGRAIVPTARFVDALIAAGAVVRFSMGRPMHIAAVHFAAATAVRRLGAGHPADQHHRQR